jgi:hypothetical protein
MGRYVDQEDVVDAWATGAHYDIRKQMPGLNNTSYPATIVKVLAGGTHGDTGTPPAGAIGVWSNSIKTPTYSHAALSTGNGTFVTGGDAIFDPGGIRLGGGQWAAGRCRESVSGAWRAQGRGGLPS